MSDRPQPPPRPPRRRKPPRTTGPSPVALVPTSIEAPLPRAAVSADPKQFERWWDKTLDAALAAGIPLERCWGDLCRASTIHMMRRLMDPKTPYHTRDKMAMRCTPLVAVELRGKLPDRDRDAAAARETDPLLAAYGLVPDPPTTLN